MDFIIIVNDNHIYKIDKEPFETDENTYIRGWYIIKNNGLDNVVSRSIMHLNEHKNNMKY
jgi:hypothetical protein